MKTRFQFISIDDNKLNLMLIESMLADMNADIHSFLKPEDALDYCLENSFDLLLVDYMMPNIDGVTLIEKIREKDPEVPIIMVTAVEDDDSIKIRALEAGATEFLNKPLKLYEFQVRVRNLMTLRENQLLLKDKAALLQKEVEEATSEIVKREIETLSILGRASEFKDTETGAHISRVAIYARLIGSEIIDSEEELAMLFYSSPLHDVGKIGIPDAILLKPAGLTEREFAVIKEHASIGYTLLAESESKYLQAGAQIAITHHEKWDGTGYPNGIKGEEIPVFGRIVAVVDVFDALLSVRPYKQPWEFDKAVDFILDNKGTMFDPAVVDAFEMKLPEIRKVYEKYKDD